MPAAKYEHAITKNLIDQTYCFIIIIIIICLLVWLFKVKKCLSRTHKEEKTNKLLVGENEIDSDGMKEWKADPHAPLSASCLATWRRSDITHHS